MTTTTQKEKLIVNEIVETAGVSPVNARNIVGVFRKLWTENQVGLVPAGAVGDTDEYVSVNLTLDKG